MVGGIKSLIGETPTIPFFDHGMEISLEAVAHVLSEVDMRQFAVIFNIYRFGLSKLGRWLMSIIVIALISPNFGRITCAGHDTKQLA